MGGAHFPETRKRFRGAFASGVFALSLSGLPVQAQQDTDAEMDVVASEGTAIEEIIVTGSRIRRQDYTSTSPVTTLDALEFRLAGATNVEDLLNTLPQVVPDFDRTSNNPGSGGATINLRGLGANRTLILLNGRRFVSSSVSGVVDINNIPAGLIERVEVVTGGASAVYGSDAISGAVNFILKTDFEGIEANVQFDITGRGDGEVYDVNLAGGLPFSDGRGHVSGFANFNERTAIFQADRAFTEFFLNDDIFTGEIFPSGSSFTPAGRIPNAVTVGGVLWPGGITFNPDGTPRAFLDPEDRFNFAPFNFLQIPLTRWTAGTFAHYDITPSVRAYAEGMFVRNASGSELAPTLNFQLVEVNTDNPLLTPATRQILADNFDPDGDGVADFALFKRFLELGPRIIETSRDMLRLVAGLQGDLANGWAWDASYIYARVDGEETLLNDGSFSRFKQSLLVDPVSGDCTDPSGGCVPANVFGEGNISEAAADFIRVDPILNTEDIEQQVFTAAVTGDALEMPAGPLGFALGVEWRKETAGFQSDPVLFTNDTLGFRPFQPAVGSFTVKEAFGEILVPLLSGQPFARYLGFEAGFRISDYSTAGTVTAWKGAGEWEPITGVRFRGSYQRAVRAPNIFELFEAPEEGVDFFLAEFADLCSASKNPAATGVSEVCIAQGLDAGDIGVFEATPFFPTMTFRGGNLDLESEKANTVTAGIVLQPLQVPGLNISLDFYSIEISDAISGIDPFDTVLLCFVVKDPTNAFCQAIERGPTGDITVVRGGQQNVARIETRGLDLQINYSLDAPGWMALFDDAATLSLWFLGNHTFRNGTQPTPDAIFQNCAGLFGFPCNVTSFGTLPAFKTTTRLTYSSGPLTVSLRWRWIDSLGNAFEKFGPELFSIPRDIINIAIPRIGDKNYFAFSFQYEIRDGLEVYGGVNNLFDNDPPLFAGSQSQSNTDPSTYDVIGRRFFVGVTYRY